MAIYLPNKGLELENRTNSKSRLQEIYTEIVNI